MAVVLAVFLKGFVLETYRIPSGSMQPTLIGDQEAEVKDRILVDKLSYLWRDPERWEVAVFRYPLDRSRSFVKRIAGVGPEELRILHGDVWVRPPGGEWTIARRPRSVMAEHWKLLTSPEGEELSPWIPQDLAPDARWSAKGRALAARGSGTAAFRGGRESIVDAYFDGYPPRVVPWLPPHPRASGENAVGDLRVTGTVRARAGLERFTLVLREGGRRYRFHLPGPAAAEGARARIDASSSALPNRRDEAPPAEVPWRLPAGRAVRFAAQNLDDRLTLELDGEERLTLAIEPALDSFATIALELEGEGADLDELAVLRDIYYTSPDGRPVSIPAGHYYMLGDNTQDSSDSREWRFAVLDATAEVGRDGDPRPLRGAWQDRENPRLVAHGGEGGPLTRLVDEWGEPHWFPPGTLARLPPEDAPCVPRELFQGRALAVFWPQEPRRGIWRLKWVK
jgi:signal peptidase I